MGMTPSRLQFTHSTSPSSRVVGVTAWRTPSDTMSGSMTEAWASVLAMAPSSVWPSSGVGDCRAIAKPDRRSRHGHDGDSGYAANADIVGLEVCQSQRRLRRLPFQAEVVDLNASGDRHAGYDLVGHHGRGVDVEDVGGDPLVLADPVGIVGLCSQPERRGQAQGEDGLAVQSVREEAGADQGIPADIGLGRSRRRYLRSRIGDGYIG